MNKTLFILLTIFFGFCFVSCSNQSESNTDAKKIADLQKQLTELQSATQKSADDTKKIADLQKQLTELQSATQKSADDTKKIADLQKKLTELQSITTGDAQAIDDLQKQVATLKENPPDSSVILSCQCLYSEIYLALKVQASGTNRNTAHKNALSLCKEAVDDRYRNAARILNCKLVSP